MSNTFTYKIPAEFEDLPEEAPFLTEADLRELREQRKRVAGGEIDDKWGFIPF